ncbi:MAG: protein kinase domain-containing protein, partial [Acidobacteriota bacterium]
GSGDDDGQRIAYIAMEFVDGDTLAQWLRSTRAWTEIVATFIDAGRGLAAAHAVGLVHRDFKPHNVLVDGRGRVLVTDFGLARAIDADDAAAEDEPGPHQSFGSLDRALTMTGAVLGTPAYMPPEQLHGIRADARSDQFAFCVTLWEALAGERPYSGATIHDIELAFETHRPRAADRVPRRVRATLQRGLAIDPAARWPSMDVLLDAITRAWRRPRRLGLAAAGGAAVTAAAVLAHHVLAARGGEPWRPRVVDLTAFEENSNGAAFSPDGKLLAYDSDREQSDVFRLYVEPVTGGEARAVSAPGRSLLAPRWTRDGKALLASTWVDGRIVRQPLDGSDPVDLGPGFHADDCGDAIAIAVDDVRGGRLVLQHPDGSRQLLVDSPGEPVLGTRCDASGQHVLYLRGTLHGMPPGNDLYVVDRAGHQTQLTRDHHTSSGAFTPDGRSVVYAAEVAGKIYLYEVPVTGGASHQLTFDDGPHLLPDVSPDGKTLVFDRDMTSQIAVAGGGGSVRKLSARQEVLVAMVATADASVLVAERASDDGSEIVEFDTRDGSERVLARGSHPFLTWDERDVLFAPSGEPARLASIALAGGAITTVATLPGPLADGAGSPDGAHVEVHRDGRATWWRVERDGRVVADDADGLVFEAPRGGWRAVRRSDGGNHFQLVTPDGHATGGALATAARRGAWLDERRFAYAASGAFHVIDAPTGREVAAIPGPHVPLHALLAADGTHWVNLALAAHVTRHLIVNFDERPWR